MVRVHRACEAIRYGGRLPPSYVVPLLHGFFRSQHSRANRERIFRNRYRSVRRSLDISQTLSPRRSSNEAGQAWRPALPELQNFFAPVFEDLFDFRHELVGEGAVDQAMVEAQREVADGADGDGVVDDDGRLVDGADSHDRDLRLVDHRRADQAAEAAEVRDGECPTLDFVGLELARTGELGEIHDGALQAEHVLL